MDEQAQAKADLIPYSPEYAGQVRSWIDSAETYHDLARSLEFPPPPDVVDLWQRDGVFAYLLFSRNRPVAYAELWDRPVELAMEVCHLLVDSSRRGEGFGTKMLDLLFDRAQRRRGVAMVTANLFGNHEIALGCFLKAGFEVAGTSKYTEGLRLVRRT